MNTGGVGNAVLGGWAVNWIITSQGGQPLTFTCPTGTTSGTSCNDILVKGQNPDTGMKSKTIDGALKPFWVNNAAAFNQPCQLGPGGLLAASRDSSEGRASIASTSRCSKDSSSTSGSRCSSELSSSTSSTTRTSTRQTSVETASWPSEARGTIRILTSAKLDQLAMLHSIRDRFNLL